MGRPSLAYDALFSAVSGKYPVARGLFLADMFDPLYRAACAYGIDPVGMVAQSGHETGWGAFGGNASPLFRNTCGLKAAEDVRRAFPDQMGGDLPLAHAQFATWHVGARAHAQHLRAYCGVHVDIEVLVVDPRYQLVSGPSCVHWRDLNGRWAGRGGTTYGDSIELVMAALIQAAQ